MESSPLDVAETLAQRVVDAVGRSLGLQIAIEEAVIREGARERGCDYQSNAAMALAKRLGRPSRELAGAIVDALEVEGITAPPEVAGPGFINFTLTDDWLAARISELCDDPRLGVAKRPSVGPVVIDYSGPNVAKEMHVGHLRSTIIGDALARIGEFLGERVIRQNHIGDWGTPFGMLIEQLLDQGWGRGRPGEGIGDLNAFYRDAREKFDSDPVFAERARGRVVALQVGDPETVRLWRDLVEESARHFQEVYRLLGVSLSPEDVAGESAYDHDLQDLVEELTQIGLTEESEGAICVFPEGFTGRDGQRLPLIVRKSDGAYNYATTDLAAIRHRVRDLGATQILYVVGAPQRLHFEMVFAVATEAGWLSDQVRATHIAFGSVLGEENKMLRTRSGAPVRLVDLLEEAVDRSREILTSRGGDVENPDDVARSIGIGAVKYADLSVDRERDYIFSFERMLSLEGNTSVYLQYANARARSVLRRAEGEAAAGTLARDEAATVEASTGNPAPGEVATRESVPGEVATRGLAPGEVATREPVPGEGGASVSLEQSAERELALAIIRLPGAIAATMADYRPHKLCTYLHTLAVAYSTFYEACPVLTAPDPRSRASRLTLCELTSRVLTLGLRLLGIDAPPRLSAPPTRVQ